MKVCKKCNIEQSDDQYRVRKCKGSFFTMGSCKECERKKSYAQYLKNKDTEEFKQKNRDNAKRYRLEYPERYKMQQKIKRQKPEYKKYVSEYYQKNRDKILEQHREVCKRAIAEGRNWYIVGRIAQKQNSNLRAEI